MALWDRKCKHEKIFNNTGSGVDAGGNADGSITSER